MKVQEILSLIPDSILDDLALETEINKSAKKLQGQLLFKLLIHCILTNKQNSLRSMESAYESIAFGLIQPGTPKRKISISSISDRLCTIDYRYFEKLFYVCVQLYGKKIGEQSELLAKFDSTIVATSGKLLKTGYHLQGSSRHLRQLKYTIGFSDIPISADVYTEQKYTSENSALKESLLAHQPLKANAIRVFDRGVTARNTYDELTKKQIPFVTRALVNSKHDPHTKNILAKQVVTDTLTIHSDSWIYLYKQNGKRTVFPIRCIKAKQKIDGGQIWFLTNVPDLSASEITELYKHRWDIEVFFKFLKQELNLTHLLNRSENGVKVVLYATLISAILLLVYKKSNQLSGYKIMKQKFLQDLEKSMVRDFVVLSGGDPKLFDKLINDTS